MAGRGERLWRHLANEKLVKLQSQGKQCPPLATAPFPPARGAVGPGAQDTAGQLWSSCLAFRVAFPERSWGKRGTHPENAARAFGSGPATSLAPLGPRREKSSSRRSRPAGVWLPRQRTLLRERNAQTRRPASSARPPCSRSHSLAAPGSRGPAHGLTRLGKTCLRFGRETG